MSEEATEIVLKHLHRLQMQPGDVLVLRCDDNLSEEMVARIRDHFKAELGDVKVIVLEGGMELSVLGTP